MGGIRRTAEGIEFTHRTVQATIGLLALVVLGVTFGLRKNDKIDGAVQRPEFRDTTAAIRRDQRTLTLAIEKIGKQSLSLNCYVAKYPVGLCDDVQRPPIVSPGRATP